MPRSCRVVAVVVAPLGILGGLVLGVATQACISSGLYLIKNIIESGCANVKDFTTALRFIDGSCSGLPLLYGFRCEFWQWRLHRLPTAA